MPVESAAVCAASPGAAARNASTITKRENMEGEPLRSWEAGTTRAERRAFRMGRPPGPRELEPPVQPPGRVRAVTAGAGASAHPARVAGSDHSEEEPVAVKKRTGRWSGTKRSGADQGKKTAEAD